MESRKLEENNKVRHTRHNVSAYFLRVLCQPTDWSDSGSKFSWKCTAPSQWHPCIHHSFVCPIGIPCVFAVNPVAHYPDTVSGQLGATWPPCASMNRDCWCLHRNMYAKKAHINIIVLSITNPPAHYFAKLWNRKSNIGCIATEYTLSALLVPEMKCDECTKRNETKRNENETKKCNK